MKSRNSNDSGENNRGDQWKMTKKKKNEKRLGGKALSLESFANAKSRASGYNPSIIKKQREFYRNAKYVSKFKKSIKREGQTEGGHTAAARFKDVDGGDENKRRPKVNKKLKEKKLVNLQDIREEVEKKRAEAEKAKMEREAMIQEKKEERARAEARRKSQRDKMFKRTRSGQPVMKYRIENILQGLLHDSTN